MIMNARRPQLLNISIPVCFKAEVCAHAQKQKLSPTLYRITQA